MNTNDESCQNYLLVRLLFGEKSVNIYLLVIKHGVAFLSLSLSLFFFVCVKYIKGMSPLMLICDKPPAGVILLIFFLYAGQM